jgi:Arc/MetJ-type ribon-helix-helix transcriptional regulator
VLISKRVGGYVGSKIPYTLKDAIEKAVNTGSYLNISNFIRDAIKEKLQREGFWTRAEGEQNNQEF